MRSIPFSPFHERPKASEWRWLEYSEPIPIIGTDASRLHAAIKTRLPPKQWVLADAYGNETRRVGLNRPWSRQQGVPLWCSQARRQSCLGTRAGLMSVATRSS